MSHLLAKIMLALLMIPLAAVIYVISMVLMFEVIGMNGEAGAFAVADLMTAAFVGAYWVLLWRRQVRWTPARTALTLMVVPVSLVIGVFAGGTGALFDDGFGVFIGGVAAILAGLFGSVLVWRETTAERQERVRAAGGDTLVCPSCGYNLTGLNESNCPECGAKYTINELVSLQPRAEDVA